VGTRPAALEHSRLARVPGAVSADQLAADLEDLEDDLGYDIDAWLPRAARIERDAEALGEVELQLRARLVQADALLRRGETLKATPVILAVHTWAVDQDRRSVLEHSHALLSRMHRVLGDPASGLEHAVCAVELIDGSASPRRRVSHLTRLADALAYTGSFDAAAERYAQAERLAVAIGDVERQILVLNNLAYYACTAGQHQLASAAVERLRSVAAADGRGLDQASCYLDTVAHVELALGHYVEAERTARAGIALYEAEGYEEAEAAAMFLLTLAMAQRHLGETGSAQRSLDRCGQLCDERDLASVRIQVQQEQAELYAAGGDLGAAFEAYKAFHRADKALVSEQREARARTRQALFETTEARREADEFREQARRDALSGLWNRRYMDEHLAALIAESAALGVPLVAAIVDLDHFKRINDQLSHETGDRVIVEVAGLLTAAVPATTGSFCARLGGEEFLLVLTGTPLGQAVDRLESLRRTVAAHPWQRLTGDLPVTISVGVAVAGPGCAQSGLLGRADAALYTAKHEGRNRVHVDPEVPVAERRRYRTTHQA
jgi:diguanylate cyclase (GGDEF)-like protein